ncbi:MAG TPA: hypothetical protein VMF29_09065 [Candidatus Edwardsbacteria bacterium]|nr:hypothetical protein [Candidatus Edwardsbacteria bacterium]
MKRLVLIAVIIALAAGAAIAEEVPVWVSAGLKLGHIFGKGGGFTWGVEASVVGWVADQRVPLGLVCDYDFCHGRERLHLGLEGCWTAFGADVGPTWSLGKDSTSVGLTVTPFLSLAIPILYYSETYYAQRSVPELGCYLKLPVPANHAANHMFDWSND